MAVVLADLNLDGFTDLAVANSASIDVWVYLGEGDGSFWSRTVHELTGIPDDIVAADVNGDGLVDLATANAIQAGHSILFATGSGLFDVATDAGDDDVTSLPAVDPVFDSPDVTIERPGGSVLLLDPVAPTIDRFVTQPE